MPDANGALRTSPFVRSLAPADRDALDGIARPVFHDPDELLVRQGEAADRLFLLTAGYAAAETGAGQGRVMLTVMGPGEVFGELALVDGRGRRTADVRALEAVRALVIERTAFERLRVRSPQVDRFVVALLAARVRRLSDHLHEALHLPVPTRVARRLLTLSGVYGSGEEVTIPLRQDQLAQLVGAGRQAVNAALRDLEDTGAVALGRGHVRLLDRARLLAVARS